MKKRVVNTIQKIIPKPVYIGLYRVYRTTRSVFDPHYRYIKSFFGEKEMHDFVLDEHSFKICLNPDNGCVDHEIFGRGVFEPGILRLIRTYLNKDSVFVDVGANIGQHSLYASLFARHVYAFEPITSIYKQFNRSIFENDIFSISTYNYALGDTTTIIPIYSNKINRGGSSLVVSTERSFLQNVKVVRLDDIALAVGLERIDVMKIDVEGYEYSVLLGAQSGINKYHPTLIIEWSPCFYNATDASISQKIITFLTDAGYTIFDIGLDAEKKEILTQEGIQHLITTNGQTNILCIFSNT